MKKANLFLVILFIMGFLGFVAMDRITFKVPENPTVGAVCEFTSNDFNESGHLKYSVNEAWWTSFTRKQEYLSSFSFALAITFAGFALIKIRQIGAKAATGGVVGGGLLVGLTLSFSCLAPVLATVGIGFFANLGLAMGEIPKWVVTLSNFILIMYGFMYLSRKTKCCPVTICQSQAKSN
ncbi:hypothetical protein [Clostridium cylindrosporum]|uniref:Uncharacterized protein n=1 Tax=Clostridium cylindrosporum DSM 605 TaxID=1121307 RepID=A0A0J8D8E5_CLOCY|nr:hypothetical protein [Clostridium cylindrosporum]KMT22142.1 hypothetical protein CLCY_4c01150 [Clostridium cylindrosporum DSM 605]